MLTLVTVFHLLLALLLVVFVLLQDPKGGGAFGMGGGGNSQSVFGASGAGNFLATATKYIAICFTVTCIALSYMTIQKEASVTDLIDEVPAAGLAPQDTAPAAAGEDKPADQ